MASVLALLIILCLVGAAWRDLAVRRIPNALACAVAVAGICLRAFDGLAALGGSLAAAAALFAALFVLFARGWLGGGDVKLATAVALGLPPAAVWTFVVLTALAGGVLSALYLAAIRLGPRRPQPAGRNRGVLRRVAAAEAWRICRRGPLPYGIALCASGVGLTATGHLWG
jgi:prepilin peptidase CpaA